MLLQFAVESERETSPDGGGPLGSSIFDASYRLAKLNGHAVARFGGAPGPMIPTAFPTSFQATSPEHSERCR